MQGRGYIGRLFPIVTQLVDSVEEKLGLNWSPVLNTQSANQSIFSLAGKFIIDLNNANFLLST